MSDNRLVKDLQKERKRREKFLADQKLSIVCQHILLEASPLKPVSVVISTVNTPHARHDGQVVLCPNCDALFERSDGLNHLSGVIYLAPEKKYRYNISNTIKGIR